MYSFKIEVAKKVIEVETQYNLCHKKCLHFLSEKPSDFCVKSTDGDIKKELQIYKEIEKKEDVRPPEAEHTVILRKISDKMLEYSTLMMHGAAIAYKNNAFLFTAVSGTGKSTHIDKWRQNLPDSFVVNGDKPFIITGETPLVCGSPWSGKEGICSTQIVPLKAIILMERADKNSISEIPFSQAMPVVLNQVYRPSDSRLIKPCFQLIADMGKKVKFYRFKFNNFKDDCFDVAYSALCGDIKQI